MISRPSRGARVSCRDRSKTRRVGHEGFGTGLKDEGMMGWELLATRNPGWKACQDACQGIISGWIIMGYITWQRWRREDGGFLVSCKVREGCIDGGAVFCFPEMGQTPPAPLLGLYVFPERERRRKRTSQTPVGQRHGEGVRCGWWATLVYPR